MPEGSSSGATGNPIVDLIIVVVLILAGGFFAASEIALITVKRHRLAQLVDEGRRAARVAQRLTENPNRFLATIQVSITFLGFLAAAVAALAFSGVVADWIRLVPALQGVAEGLGIVLVTLLIALTAIIIGELVPKTLALNFPEGMALIVARPIGWLDRLLRPVVWLVTRTSLVLVRAMGGTERPQAGYLSTEELKMLVETGSEQGGIEEDEKEMIHGIIELGDKSVHEVMIPRIGIKAVEVNQPLDEVLDLIVRAGHSRVPVYEESLDNIVGILYAKDLLPYLKRNGSQAAAINVRALARSPVYVPESKLVDELLHDMQNAKRHIAIVVDEYGGTAGLVTIEDIVEEIVGEIQDEYDTEEPMVEPIESDGSSVFRLDGRMSMDDLRDLFEMPDTDEPDEEAYDTVGGLVIHRSGRIPLPGEEIAFRDVMLRIEAADSRRVSKIIAERQQRVDDEDVENGD
jgi:putative hemolysin